MRGDRFGRHIIVMPHAHCQSSIQVHVVLQPIHKLYFDAHMYLYAYVYDVCVLCSVMCMHRGGEVKYFEKEYVRVCAVSFDVIIFLYWFQSFRSIHFSF